MFRLAIAANLVLAALLAGCGDNTPAAQKGPPAPRGIFISASDCADAGKISIENCGRAIDDAVAAYQQTAPSYKSLRSCDSALGPDRCVRGVDGKYRPQLQAFLVTMSTPASAVALYPPAGANTKGFRSKTGAVSAFDDGYTISASAQAVASDNSHLRAKED